VTVNASSISDDLFESEMFGHVKGAFTGAVADRRGHVVEAEGGTLFLDEVTDLTLRGQAKLLRFLQNGEFRRVGEGVVRRANVRLLTAANVVLREQVARGLFRPDLLYRCTTFTLVVPPLRERADDVLLLARHFLRSAQVREARPVKSLPREIAQLLLRFEWPGNVRQLQSEMNRLATLAGSESIRIEHVSPEIMPGTRAPGRTLNDARSACERDLIVRTLPLYGGNRSRAACALGITRQGLLSKMRQLGL
jgi:DNA-binding NtrC family response regulator